MNKPVNCRCGGEAEIFHIAPEGYEGSYCVRCTECLIQTPFFNKDKDKAIEVWNRAMGERTAKALSRELDAVVRFEEGGVTFTYDKGTSILHECESCGTFVKPGEIYCHNCGARLEWE